MVGGMDIPLLRIYPVSAVLLILTACATATPYPVTGGPQANALVKGDSVMDALIPGMTVVAIESVDGKDIKGTQSSLLLPPGHYTLTVHCVTPGTNAGDDPISIYRDLVFSVVAGHEYTVDGDSVDSGPEGVEVEPTAHIAVFDSIECVPYVYDSTGGRDPYSESVTFAPPGDWSRVDDDAQAGYAYTEKVPKGQDSKDWRIMLKTESFTRPMYSGSAEDLYQDHVTDRKSKCPNLQVTVRSEKTDDVTYEFDYPSDCRATETHAEYGRFLTGTYGVYRAAVLSRDPVQAADAAAWLAALQSAAASQDQ